MDEETFNMMAQKRIVYELPGMERVNVRRDITYKTVDEYVLNMDAYYPPDVPEGTALPAVLLVSGDLPPEFTLRGKDTGDYVSYGELVAASGLIAVTFNHRSLEGYSKLREVGSDVDDLVGYVREHAATLNIDAGRLCIWTFSSGPIYGLRTAMRGTPDYVRCIVAYYGGMSLLNKAYFTYTEDEEELLREFSPVTYLREATESVAPLFVAKAGLDRPWLNESIDEFVQEASTRNVPITFVNHPVGLHGFDLLNDDARSREIVRATLEFVKTHLSGSEVN